MKRRIGVVAVLAGLFMLIGGVAVASIPDASGVIHGCRKNTDGSLRVVDTDLGQTCPNGWTPLDWRRDGRRTAFYTKAEQRGVPLMPAGTEMETRHFSISCPAGMAAVSGGALGMAGGDDRFFLVYSKPAGFELSPVDGSGLQSAPTGWELGLRLMPEVQGPISGTVYLYVVCSREE